MKVCLIIGGVSYLEIYVEACGSLFEATALLARRFVQSCLFKGMSFPALSSLCSKRLLTGLLMKWFDQEGAMMI